MAADPSIIILAGPNGDVIRRRYSLGLRNLFSLYLPLATTWDVYDKSCCRIG